MNPLQIYNEFKGKNGFSAEIVLYYMLGIKGDKFTGLPIQKILDDFDKNNKLVYTKLLKTCMSALYELKIYREGHQKELKKDFIGVKSIEDYVKLFSDLRQGDRINKDLLSKFVIKYTSTLINQLPPQYKLIIDQSYVDLKELEPKSSDNIYSLIILHVIFDILYIALLYYKNQKGLSITRYNFYDWILLYRQILEDDINKVKRETITLIRNIIDKKLKYSKEYIDKDFKIIIKNIHDNKDIPRFFSKGELAGKKKKITQTQTQTHIISFSDSTKLLLNVSKTLNIKTNIPIIYQFNIKKQKDVKSDYQNTRDNAIPYRFLGKKRLPFYIYLSPSDDDRFSENNYPSDNPQDDLYDKNLTNLNDYYILTWKSFISSSSDYASPERQKIALIVLLHFIYADLININEFNEDDLTEFKTYLDSIK